MKIVLLTPLTGNGGIASWSKKFIKTFPSKEYEIIPIDRSVCGVDVSSKTTWDRITVGLRELRHTMKALTSALKNNKVDIIHTTTSGGFGTVRDYLVARLAQKHGIQVVMHCHYGCISENVENGLFGKFLLKTFASFNQVWVLDRRSQAKLNSYPQLKDKVFLTPNSIKVNENVKIPAKNYKHVAFIANWVREKGLMELVRAVMSTERDITLSIVGKEREDVLQEIKDVCGEQFGTKVKVLGLLPNDQAVEFLKTVDILALPTYMPSEAFPISILEAMSLGKLVLSTHRAAIGDMLTGEDGEPCGLFVEEQSVDDITRELTWAVDNPTSADKLCRRAYEKVYNSYRTEVVYELYKSLYRKMIAK